MSTSQPQQTSLNSFVPEHSSTRIDASDAYDEFIANAPGVCNACFAIVKRDHQLAESGTHAHAVEDHDPYGEVTVREGHEDDADSRGEPVVGTTNVDTYGELRTYHERTACSECGTYAGDGRTATLSRRDALALVPSLADRVREHGLEVDETAMRETIRRLKSIDAVAGKDAEIFRRAVKLGIQFARSSR